MELLLPKYLYHLVPQTAYNKYYDGEFYDCRFKIDWGGNLPYIHTTPNKKQLKLRVADKNWAHLPKEINFVILKIFPGKVKSKITFKNIGGFSYFHIWGALDKNTFEIKKIERDSSGKFVL